MSQQAETPRRLIVNADDFGLSPAVNSGILAAHTEGILTSATLLANAPAFDEAVAIAKKTPSLGVGVHLNLVRGKPLSPVGEVPALVSADGVLRRFRLRRLTPGFLRAAAAEYRRQVEKVVAAGIRPTHIDFEKHHAWQAPLYRVACQVAAEQGIPAVRTFREPVAWSVRRLGWPGWKRAGMAAFLRSGFQLGGGAGLLAAPDRLLGQTHIGAMNEAAWLKLLQFLPEGTTEVMTHPGEAEAGEDSAMGASWLGEGRVVELAALCSPRVKEAVTRGGIELATFGVFGAGPNLCGSVPDSQ